jgi:RNA polymerase sigma-70 factor (ECF subfamily)
MGTMEPLADKLVSERPWLRRLARRMVRSQASADDLVQDTCITALRNAPPDVQMRPWLRSVMRKLAVGYVRSEERRAQREEIFYQITPATAEPDALVEYGVDRARLAEAVETLPEPFRATVVQCFIEGRTCAEIARAEQISDATVRWRQMRALELLRSELDGQAARRRARRRHLIWWFPLAGAGERIAVRVGEGLFSLFGQSKAAWFVLAGVAAAIGLGSLREATPPQHLDKAKPAAMHTPRVAAASLLAPARGHGQQPGRAEQLLTHGMALVRESLLHSPDDESPAIAAHARDADDLRERLRTFEAIRDQYEPHLDDCELDSQGKVRCPEPPVLSTIPGRPTCDSIHRNVAFSDINRRINFMTHAYANRFLMAAMLANVALGTSLGCSLPTGSGGSDSRKVSVGNGDSDCVNREGPNGEPCVTCTDASGAETTMCAPADCYIETMPEGSVCTTCTDVNGGKKTVCEEAPPTDCVSEVKAAGLLCTTCTVNDQPVTTCSSAHCYVTNRCMECQDPRGNTGTDCSIDYEVLPTGMSMIGSGDTYHSCTTSWGFPDGSTTSCHYPGLDTCTYSQPGQDARCIDCRYPDGSGLNTCLYDPNDPLPDVFAHRPDHLPPPGTCVDKTSPDGAMACTTCTRQDLTATTTCRHPAATQCEVVGYSDPFVCVNCTHADGTNRTFCEPMN